tara:strand:+ start:436 stop:591 length:156 start_codon:yes stop_codon:yes gene_type:complete
MSDVQLALLFPFIPVLLLLLVYYASGADIDDDDDNGGGKGMLQPIYAPAPN